MKCNLCGQEYEFSLGHRCQVMQEESKQPTTQPDLVKCGCDEYPECTHVLYWYQGFKAGAETRSPAAQPDLVSKLREVMARMHAAVRWDKGIAPLVVAGWADELESLLGEGQAAEPEPQPLPDYCFECDDTSRCASAEICYAHHEGYPKIVTKPCGPSQPETEGDAGRQPVSVVSPSVQLIALRLHEDSVEIACCLFNKQLLSGDTIDDAADEIEAWLRALAPSTPIVPGTAGLSAAKVQSWANNCAVYERQHAAIGDFAGVEYHRGAKEAFQRVADALLGAERPAQAGEVKGRNEIPHSL